MVLPLYGLAAGLWAYGAKRVARDLDEATLPWLASLTAASFALSFIALPCPAAAARMSPGGTAGGLFRIWNAFMAASMVFAIQALLFGDGGVTTLR